jgi:alkylated DNA nucleotide flippase Atl1
MVTENVAIAALARTVGEALLKFAAEYPNSSSDDDAPTAVEVELPVGRGQRQQQILDLSGLATESGVKTSDVANEIDYEVPNTYSTLQALERNGLVEMVPGSSPQRWRLAPRYRNTAPVFKRLASRVKEGEWTTYGEISIAVRGDTNASKGVGRAAAKHADFPHPERVLMVGGQINPNWVDAQGRGPEHCKQLLLQQGVRFDENGCADVSQRVSWDELRRRDEAEPVS